MEKLAKVLDSRMEEHSGGGFSFDFGVIKKDYSLVSNTFPLPIPKGLFRLQTFGQSINQRIWRNARRA